MRVVLAALLVVGTVPLMAQVTGAKDIVAAKLADCPREHRVLILTQAEDDAFNVVAICAQPGKGLDDRVAPPGQLRLEWGS